METKSFWSTITRLLLLALFLFSVMALKMYEENGCKLQRRVGYPPVIMICNVTQLKSDMKPSFEKPVNRVAAVTYRCDSRIDLPSSLGDRLFENFHSLKSFSIIDCLLTSIFDNAFKVLAGLDRLVIKFERRSNNKFRNFCKRTETSSDLGEVPPVDPGCQQNSLYFSKGILSGLKNVNRLTINGVRLNDSIWKEIENLRNLKYLTLRDNNIVILENGSLHKLTQLKYLDLRNNYIPEIPNGAFEPLFNLRELYLSTNDITVVGNDAFKGLTKLFNLDLKNNRINTIYNGTFQSLVHLRRLDLSYNSIVTIENGGFRGLKALSYLNLKTNKISAIMSGTFSHTKSLQELRLSNNTISQLTEDTVVSWGNIKLLDISHNSISSIFHKFAYVSLNSETLIMHHNNVTELSWLSYSSFPSLRIIDISYNKINQQGIDIPFLPIHLEELNISWNDMPSFTITYNELDAVWYYNPQRNIKYIDIRHNQISAVSVVEFSKQSTKPSTPIILYLEGNPFHCDCKLAWLKQIVTSSNGISDTYFIRDFDRLYCQSVYRHKPGSMMNINSEIFLCRYNESCPKLCTCYRSNTSVNVNVVDCKNSKITHISNEITKKCTELDMSENDISFLEPSNFDRLSHLEQLDIHSNHVSEIKEGTFKNLSFLSKLNLMNNSISLLYADIFEGLIRLEILSLGFNSISKIRKGSFEPLKALQYLDLRGNHLKTIQSSEFNSLSQIPIVYISRNPWSCDCKYLEIMHRFFIKNAKRIGDYDEVACEYSYKVGNKEIKHQLSEVYMPEFCLSNTYMDNNTVAFSQQVHKTETSLAIGIVLSVLSITAVVVFGVLFKKRECLKIWCYIRFGWKFRRCKQTNDDTRPYDAFILYSSQDVGIVVRELLPRLEETKDGRDGYKICLQDRDFLGGANIAESIIEAVNRSKRVIIVLSDNFLNCEWSQYGFQRAHYQLLKERRNRIITVLLEDINSDLLYKELKLFLKAGTCIRYDDPWFWPKIEYAMPERKVRDVEGLNEVNNGDHIEFIPLNFTY